jgi:rod shape-determining protein MreC
MYRSAMLNRGTADGVSVYDPVVGPKGLLGRVVSVEEHFCNILLLTDPECKFGAFIRRTREIGLAMGNGHGVILSHMNKQSDVQSGDLVLTSHDSGLTPAGILIGEVDQVEVHEDELMLMITIKPASDFNRLDSVIILKYGKSPK